MADFNDLAELLELSADDEIAVRRANQTGRMLLTLARSQLNLGELPPDVSDGVDGQLWFALSNRTLYEKTQNVWQPKFVFQGNISIPAYTHYVTFSADDQFTEAEFLAGTIGSVDGMSVGPSLPDTNVYVALAIPESLPDLAELFFGHPGGFSALGGAVRVSGLSIDGVLCKYWRTSSTWFPTVAADVQVTWRFS